MNSIRFEELYAESSRNGIYKTKEFHGSGNKIINMGELFAYDFISNQKMKRLELSKSEKNKYSLEDRDLVFGRRSVVAAGAGKCSLIVNPNELIVFESSIIRVRLNKKIANPKFYFYYFKSPQGRGTILSIATGVNIMGIRSSELQKLIIPFPEILIQNKVASTLSAYDNLIENNTRRIQILEEMAQRIYKDWFVDFKYPSHENDQMVDSELGMIPDGWEVVEVANLLKRLKAGNKYTKMNVSEKGLIPVIDQSEKEILGYHDNDPDHLATNYKPIIIFGDHTCKMQLLVEPFSIGPNVIPFISKIDYPIYFLYYLVNSLVETQEYKRHWNDLIDKIVIIPKTALSDNFSGIVNPLFQQISGLKKLNQNLGQTRDLLLPKLISGNIDISDLDIDTSILND